ncbi:MAG TPA: globin [Bryobacteraceae bacterium]|nr:globin [Bryobacteraceae bacterium]
MPCKGAETASIVFVDEQEIYSLIGEAGFNRLIAAFYRRIPQDDILGPMYGGEDLQGAEQRLRDFLIFRFGGPPRYIQERGHPRLRMRHARFAVGQAARNRWMELMDQAVDEAELPGEVAEALRSFFDSTATFLINAGE